jgi:hypothetical protein
MNTKEVKERHKHNPIKRGRRVTKPKQPTGSAIPNQTALGLLSKPTVTSCKRPEYAGSKDRSMAPKYLSELFRKRKRKNPRFSSLETSTLLKKAYPCRNRQSISWG